MSEPSSSTHDQEPERHSFQTDDSSVCSTSSFCQLDRAALETESTMSSAAVATGGSHSSQHSSLPSDGPALFARSLFRSSTFSAPRELNIDQSCSLRQQGLSGQIEDTPTSTQPSKSFFKSSSFIHKDHTSSIAKSLSRAVSSLSTRDQESAQDQKSNPISGFSKWARSFRSRSAPDQFQIPESSPYNLFANRRASPKVLPVLEVDHSFGVFTKGFFDSSKNAVKAVQTKARHLVSQNKRRYQEDGFDLDMAYITENVIAMGFPAGDMSSGLLGFVEGFYRNHMEEVIMFFDTQHLGKYKVYNLCSERLYDASLLEGKVACFPFDDKNCPPLQLVMAFCESSYAWLKAGLENVVVVHCKGGMARTGLMISCLLLYLKFFPTAEESINYYNQKRCVDGKGLNLPSQLRYVKYFERVLREHFGFTPIGRRCLLRRIKLNNCPSWIRPAVTISDHKGVLFSSRKHPETKFIPSEDLWLCAIKKGVVVLELPDNICAAPVDGDFKIQFHDRHGDFSCWLNTNMMESKVILLADELDGFDKRRLAAADLQVELELIDNCTGAIRPSSTELPVLENAGSCLPLPDALGSSSSGPITWEEEESDNIFTDSEGEGEEEDLQGSGTQVRPFSESREDVTRWGTSPQNDVPKAVLTPSTSQNGLQNVLSNAVSELSTGILNAMDRFGMTHLAGHGNSVSVPSSPRIPYSRLSPSRSAEFTRSVDFDWSHGGSRFQNVASHVVAGNEKSQDIVRNSVSGLTPDHATTVLGEGETNRLSMRFRDTPGSSFRSDNPHLSFRSEDPGSSFQSEDDQIVNLGEIPSDFQALATASAADASLFTFGDSDDEL